MTRQKEQSGFARSAVAWLSLGFAFSCAFWPAGASAATVTVFAAASLTDSLKEIATAYEKESGDRVAYNFGASSTLARQIEAGAPANVFFSADEVQMDALENQGFIAKETRTNRLSNSLVIVVAAEGAPAITSPKDLAGPKIKRIALGDPRAVPIGIYAREYLQKLKLWEAVQPKVVATENVRAALTAVEAGNADASIVYKTDAAISKRVKVALAVSLADGPSIRYPMALVKGAKQAEAAKRLLSYLASESADKLFVKYGFVSLR